MTRVFLAAGVAALAIAAPAAAGPHNGGGNGGGEAAFAAPQRGGGGGDQRAVAAPQRVQQFSAPRMQRQAFAAPRIEHQQRIAIQRPQRVEGGQAMRAERMQARPQGVQQAQARAERMQARPQRVQQAQARAERMQARPQIQNRFAQRQQVQQNRFAQRQQLQANRQQAQADRQQVQQNRFAQRQQAQANRQQVQQNRFAQRQQAQGNRQQVQQNRFAQQQQLPTERMQQVQNRIAQQQLRGNRFANAQLNGQGYGVGGCPPGLASKGCMPPGQANKLGLGPQVITAANMAALRNAEVNTINTHYGTRIAAPTLAMSLIGAPINTAPSILGMSLSPIPQSISYLYPSTPNYYYQYGDGYLYQVDRSTSLIDALIPLLAGGYMPGSYLPQPYMSSYVPDYYGLNSFYPASYSDYYGADYGGYYGNTCNRYANGVVYQVDCMTGMVENVIPTYAGGYGVGQMLPAAYNTYNLPYQYRDMYAPTSDYSYWYAPGAIYQVDPGNSMITSVAALLSPGFSVGQPLPMGYDTYNVPYAYRSTYADTSNAWYRYNNGYIYQVDPTSQLVTAIVASLLT